MNKITYSNEATIPSGIQYSNIKTRYELTREFEGDHDKELHEIKGYIDAKIVEDFKMYQDFLKQKAWEGRKTIIDGVEYAHVTDIITPETPPIPYIEEHALLGTYLDQLAKETYFPEDRDIIIPKVPNIKTQPQDIDEQWDKWFVEFGGLFKPLDKDVKIINKDHNFVGEADFIASHEKEVCICDFKKTEKLSADMKEKYFMQMAAYAKNMRWPIEKMAILSPFNKPIFSDEMNSYYEKFLVLRGQFKERFGF